MKAAGRRVVISGIGLVTSVGIGRVKAWENLLAGKFNIKEIPAGFENNYRFRSRFFVPFPEFTIRDFGLPSKYESLMEDSTRAAVVAAKIAMEDAGIEWNDTEVRLPVAPGKISIVLGTGICSLKAGFVAFKAHSMDPSCRYNRMVIPMIMPNSASSWISILTGIKGATFTLNASCASGTVAIGEAYRKIRDGSSEMVLAGGFECLKDHSGTIMRGFDGLGTLTVSPDGLPRPFSTSRSGFLFAEGGACILVLETLDRALERGVEPFAEIIGYECNSDAYNIVQMDTAGTRVKEMLEVLTKGKKIDYFNAHGTGTQQNDETEIKVIQSLFGEKNSQPYINSTKSITGHTIGASGAIEAAVTAMSVKNSMIHRTLSDDSINDLNLALENIPCRIRYAISASYGFGGHNAALLLGNI